MISPIRCIVIFISIIFTLSSCEFNITTAHVENIKVCSYLEGKLCTANTPVFGTKVPVIYASCNLKNAPENTLVTFVWKYTINDDTIVIDELTLNSSDKGINLDLNCSLSKPYNDWPVGSYEVNVIIVDSHKEPKVRYFEVREETYN